MYEDFAKLSQLKETADLLTNTVTIYQVFISMIKDGETQNYFFEILKKYNARFCHRNFSCAKWFEVWPALYDKQKLRENSVPCAAAIYYNDMYVDHVYQEETAAMIPNFKCWVGHKNQNNNGSILISIWNLT